MSFARTVVKMSHMPVEMQENAIQVAQEAIRDNNTEEVSGGGPLEGSLEGAAWGAGRGPVFPPPASGA